MTKAAPKLTLAPPQTIPLDKLALHEGNVRQIKAGVSLESLAADIERRGLLQSLSVRPILNEASEETGSYAVQAGGRRLRALQLLVKQKKLAKNAPVPCIVRSEGFVEADSLAENTEREALHPLDQFRAFKALADKGEGEETIAAAFSVSAHVVKQRLRLAKASPALLQAYEDDQITLDQLMAFCLSDDHDRQEQVFDAIQKQWNKGADAIRRMLTEKTVHAGDRRAIFVGADAYKAAGGVIIRDLFDEDDGGWLQDVPLLERLVSEKLAAEAEAIKAEGWGWVEAAVARCASASRTTSWPPAKASRPCSRFSRSFRPCPWRRACPPAASPPSCFPPAFAGFTCFATTTPRAALRNAGWPNAAPRPASTAACSNPAARIGTSIFARTKPRP